MRLSRDFEAEASKSPERIIDMFVHIRKIRNKQESVYVQSRRYWLYLKKRTSYYTK